MPLAVPARASNESAAADADIGELRLHLLRRIMTLRAAWRRCDLPCCRRARHCVGPGIPCRQAEQSPPLPPEEQARLMAVVYRAVRRRAAELEAAGETGAKHDPETLSTPAPARVRRQRQKKTRGRLTRAGRR